LLKIFNIHGEIAAQEWHVKVSVSPQGETEIYLITNYDRRVVSKGYKNYSFNNFNIAVLNLYLGHVKANLEFMKVADIYFEGKLLLTLPPTF
jgi:hypothetical protein